MKLPHTRLAPPQPYLSPEQVRKLVFALREPYRTTVLTAVLTGLRPSELFALSWPDVDFERQIIQISRSCYMGEFGMPKTPRSRRALVMPSILQKALQEHRQRTRHIAGELVFSTRDGKPIDPSRVLKKAVHPVLARLKIPRVGWRAFRHTVATLLQQMGVPVKIAQEQLGHANPTTTLAIYLFPDVPKLPPNAAAV